jgi:hypothetical protein
VEENVNGDNYQIWVDFFLVLKSMPSAFHVHLFGVGIVEFAATQFTVETETDFQDKKIKNGLKNQFSFIRIIYIKKSVGY